MNIIRTILGPPSDRPYVVVLYSLVALLVLAIYASADGWQCTDPDGCTALQSSDSGSRVVKFKRGDIISSQGGWIPDPPDGWDSVGLAWRNRAIAGLLPL